MQIGLFLNTHGVGDRDENDWYHQPMRPEEMRPVESAQLAERLGYHSVWMGDHVAPLAPASPVSPAWVGGVKPHYPAHPNLLDGAVVMGAIATHTSRIKMGPSVLITPYRHPLSDARQFATIDYLSQGRLIMGVGAGWWKEEFDSMGQPHEHRLAMLEECIQVYQKCWTEPVVSFQGRFYQFDNISMDPKPVQKPRPLIIVGATTPAGARVIARRGEGFFPVMARSYTDPHLFDNLQDEIRRECARIGRDPGEIAMMGFCSARIGKADGEEATRTPRRTLGGTAEQILSDLERFAEAGYSFVSIAPACPSVTYAEFEEQAEWLGREVLPEAKKIQAKGEWRKAI